MALITCKECGHAVSSKATACVSCGAPLNAISGIDLVPRDSKLPPPTREQIKRRAILSLSILVAGVIWASVLDHRPGANRWYSFAAALLIIGGLCSLLVVGVHAVLARR